jgi:uncharacterized protein (DUF58 family)
MNKSSRTIVIAVAGLILGALILRSGDLAWLALIFLSYLGLGLFLAPTREDVYLRAERSCQETERLEHTSIEVCSRVQNIGAKTIHVLLVDPPMENVKVTEGELRLRTTLHPREDAELRYVFQTFRGYFEWKHIIVKVSDPFGLFEVEARPAAEAKTLVQPSYRKWQSMPLRLQKTLPSPGSIPIRQGGGGTDFWGIREYQPGDPLKRLYWRLSARNPLRRYTKEFIQERTAEVILVLDGRQRMDFSAGGESLFEKEVATVAALAGMLIRQGQRVGLFVMGTRPLNVFPDYGRIQLRRILNCLAGADPQSEKAQDSLRFLPTLRYARSAFMVVVSPFDEDDIGAFQRLRALGYQAVLISPDTLHFARSIIAGDRLSSLARGACRLERKIGLNRIASLGFPVIDWRTERELQPLLKAALAHLAPAQRSAGWKP